ncbi:MAG: hypothetical protein GJT30_14090 [Geobacter sp.]|nr:hypothetical protein [Geobacter sp.]
MRKSIIGQENKGIVSPEMNWLDLPNIARVELTSEESSHPIESALNPFGGSGWRASEPGRQTIRLLFDEPLHIRRVHLVFHEGEQQRTQEFVLRWSPDVGRSYEDIVRQQYNFTPQDTSQEIEDYTVDLAGVTAIELVIVPDINGGSAHASLGRLRLA